MPVTKSNEVGNVENWRGWHILTVAESGFSMLMGYACDGLYSLDRTVVSNFAEQVNRQNVSGSLHPKASISALPNRYFRDIPDQDIPSHIEDFKNELNSFIDANRSRIKAKNIMIDFHVSQEDISPYYLDATTQVFNNAINNGVFEQVVVIADTSVNELF